MRRLVWIGVLAGGAMLASIAHAQSTPTVVRIAFEAQADSFHAATQEYERIWREDGVRIIVAMERRSTLHFVYPLFADTAIRALVLERASSSGYRDLAPMELRASYPGDTKRATLIHELGHRLMAGLHRREEEEHEALFLWLYDVWIDVYGQRFADEQVAIERRRRGPYPQAWDAVTALNAEERSARWQSVLRERLATRR
jgi:hypothetical protein